MKTIWKNLDLRCNRYRILNNFHIKKKLNNKNVFLERLDKQSTLGPTTQATLVNVL